MAERIKRWCDTAVSKIKYRPDREAVWDELKGHLDDRYNDFVKNGMLIYDAETKALEAMGDPTELADELAKVHRPFWGYMLTTTEIVLAIACVLTLLLLPRYIGNMNIKDRDELMTSMFTGFNPYSDEDYENEYGVSEMIFYLEPDVSDYSDGYKLTLTNAALRKYTPNAPEQEVEYNFYFCVDCFDPHPWTIEPELRKWLYAVDSEGNYYYSSAEQVYTNEPNLGGNPYRTGLMTFTMDMWANNYVSQDAEWIEFRCDRDGRDIKLRLDLTGGEEP